MIHKNKTTWLLTSTVLSFAVMTCSFAETRYKVKSTDNLNKIIDNHYQQSDLSRSQLLVGVLAKNQQAFRGGNINFLLRGKQLLLPEESDIKTLSDTEAKELLANHARYFRRGRTGDFGSPIAGGYLVSNRQKTTSALQNKQILQTDKIDRLEKESEDLRNRLDRLIAEKNQSDAKLRQLEETLQNTFDKSRTTNSLGNAESELSDAELDKKKLTEQASKKIDGFQSINAQKTQILNPLTKELSGHLDNSSMDDGKGQISLSDNQENVKGVSDKEAGIWPIMAILERYYIPVLALLLFVFTWIFWNKNKKNRLIADEVYLQPDIEQAYLDDADFLNKQSEEAPLKNSVKIDMARAYIEAGDTDSASNILNKLINEGNSAETKQAQKLLNTL